MVKHHLVASMCNSVCRGQNSGERIKLYKWHLLEHEIQFKNTLKVNAHGKKKQIPGTWRLEPSDKSDKQVHKV